MDTRISGHRMMLFVLSGSRIMAKLRNPIKTVTKGGIPVIVTAITRRAEGPIDGYAPHPEGRKILRWDHGGHALCGDALLDLDMEKEEHRLLRGPLPRYVASWHPRF